MKHIKTPQELNEHQENSNISDASESKLSGNFRIDLSDFQRLSIDVGYMNKCANIKYYDDNGDEYYDEEDIQKYEKLRGKQLDMFEKMSVSFFIFRFVEGAYLHPCPDRDALAVGHRLIE